MLLIIAALSYLVGSIPFGYLLVRIFRGEDVRQSGSGNIGATNVFRKSPALGVATLLLDALKGTAAVALSYAVADRMVGGPTAVDRAALAALFAVVGHVFPVWLKFRGGKGVATALGAFALIAPKAVLIAAGIFIAVVVISRYVS
ncbi:MAG: glycerol-3-phosphate acyltransferase, partial [Candidatus Sulfotelmatobacter sp.]